MTDELQIKGSTLNSKIAFTRDRWGDEAARELQTLLTILAKATGGQVLDGSWYPFSTYEAVLRHIADRHYGGDVAALFEVGVYSAEKSLTGIYDFYAQLDFPRFLQRIGTLHHRFYSKGELVVEHEPGETSCRIRMRGAAPYVEPDLHVAAGFYAGAGRVMGLDDVRCHFEKRGDEVVFRLDW